MKYLVCLVLNLLIATVVFAQPTPDTLWTRIYEGNNGRCKTDIQQTTDGGYVIAVPNHIVEGGYDDIYVVKTNNQGDTLWSHAYGGNFLEEVQSIRQTTDGGYAVAGSSVSSIGRERAYLVKTNSQGDTIWTRTYGGELGDYYANSMQQTADGGYVLAGALAYLGPPNDMYDYYVVRTDAQGDTLWTRTYIRSGGEEAYSIQQTLDGGFVIVGYISLGWPNWDFYLMKINSQGDVQWTHCYGGSGLDWASSIQLTSDGGYVIAGETNLYGSGGPDAYIVKTDDQGNPLWTQTYGGSGEDWAFSIKQTTDGGYIFGGWTTSFGAGGQDFYVVKTNGQGAQQWTRTYGGSGVDEAYSIQQTIDGSYVIAGRTNSFGAGDYHTYVVKTGPDPCFHPIPATPQVVITTVDEDARLIWNRVTQSTGGCPITVNGYLVFYSPTSGGPFYYHGFTTDTAYVHTRVVHFNYGMFYQVVASTEPISLLQALPSSGENPPLLQEDVLYLLKRQHVDNNTIDR